MTAAEPAAMPKRTASASEASRESASTIPATMLSLAPTFPFRYDVLHICGFIDCRIDRERDDLFHSSLLISNFRTDGYHDDFAILTASLTICAL